MDWNCQIIKNKLSNKNIETALHWAVFFYVMDSSISKKKKKVLSLTR